jgi:hypothetical protein
MPRKNSKKGSGKTKKKIVPPEPPMGCPVIKVADENIAYHTFPWGPYDAPCVNVPPGAWTTTQRGLGFIMIPGDGDAEGDEFEKQSLDAMNLLNRPLVARKKSGPALHEPGQEEMNAALKEMKKQVGDGLVTVSGKISRDGDGAWKGSCGVCGVECGLRCAGCREPFKAYAGPLYCSAAHQKAHWKTHRFACRGRTAPGLDAADIVFSLDGDHRVRCKGGDRELTDADLDGVVFVRNDGARDGSEYAGTTTRVVSLVTGILIQRIGEFSAQSRVDKEYCDGAKLGGVTIEHGWLLKADEEKYGGLPPIREKWSTIEGAPLTVRDLVGLVMVRFDIKLPPASEPTHFYSDSNRISVRDKKTLAERGSRTFSLESYVGSYPEGPGPIPPGPTYLL